MLLFGSTVSDFISFLRPDTLDLTPWQVPKLNLEGFKFLADSREFLEVFASTVFLDILI